MQFARQGVRRRAACDDLAAILFNHFGQISFARLQSVGAQLAALDQPNVDVFGAGLAPQYSGQLRDLPSCAISSLPTPPIDLAVSKSRSKASDDDILGLPCA